MYNDIEVELTDKEKESIAASEELQRYQDQRKKERERTQGLKSDHKTK